MKPDYKINLKENEEGIKVKSNEKINFDPREIQNKIKGDMKVYKRGDKYFIKVDDEDEKTEESNDRNIRKKIMKSKFSLINVKFLAKCKLPRIHIVDKNYAILTQKIKKIPKLNDLSLGTPYGIQLGLRNLINEGTTDLKALHAVDIVLVAQAISCLKHPANWNNKDIDQILLIGAELRRKTENFYIEPLKQFTKGFPYRDKFLQVTCSEPIIVGKIVTVGDRSMDLYNGLNKFFASYQSAYFSTSTLDLYIMLENDGKIIKFKLNFMIYFKKIILQHF